MEITGTIAGYHYTWEQLGYDAQWARIIEKAVVVWNTGVLIWK